MRFTVKLGSSNYGVDRPWAGDTYRSTHDSAVAFDVETEMREGQTIPRLALFTASIGVKTCVGHPDQLADFVLAHKGSHWVAFNGQFDFWVCVEHLRARSRSPRSAEAEDVLWAVADSGRFHDAMLLDQLLRLGEGRIDFKGPDDENASVYARNLGVVAREYAGLELDKTDPYRKRFAELIDRDWADPTIEPGFWSYAAKDTVATHFAWRALVKRARALASRARKLYPGHVDDRSEEKWGLLTESLQTRATIALADISRRGFAVDKEAAAIAEAKDRSSLAAHQGVLHALAPDLFKYTSDPKSEKKADAPGQSYFPGFEPARAHTDIAVSPKSGAPQFKSKALLAHLTDLSRSLGVPLPRSTGKKKDVSKSAKDWAEHADRDVWLKAWCELVKLSTGLKFFNLFKGDGPAVHTRFNPLLLTGRTSASKPSVQQCCSGDTELLTSRGWVRFDSISEDDAPEAVAQFDPETREVSFVAPEQWVEQRWSKPLVHLSNSNVDFCVTHDHRCLVETRDGKLEVKEAKAAKGDVAILHAGNFAGGNSDIGLPFLLFLIAFQADGTWNEQGRMAFHLKRDDKIQKLKQCLDALGAKATGKRNPNSGTIHVVVVDEDLTNATRDLLGPDKLFGPWLLGLTREALDFFAEEVWAWDGDKERETGYTSEHEHNAGWVQIVCALSARRAQVRKYVNNGGRTAYVVDHSAEDSSSYITHADVEELKSPGKVYCVTVPSGFIVTRRDGKVTITGNCPRDSDFRKLFVARPGFQLLTADYSFIELRTLAATIKAREKVSRMLDVILEGRDPHSHTASLFLGVPYEQVVIGCNDEKKAVKEAKAKGRPLPPTPYSKARQQAKAVNFGVPGGLGPAKLAWYAKTSYGVDMSVEEAAVLRHKLVHEVYPELELYLADDSLRNLQWTLGVSPDSVARAFHIDDPTDAEEVGRTMKAVGKVLRGNPNKADGTPYKPQYVERIWVGLASLVRKSRRVSPADRQRVEERKPSPALEARLLGGPTITLTGRVRSNASYTQARNTPFQGLAADGMKLAIWHLCRLGFRTVNMVHDEVINELPEATAESDAKSVEAILCTSMEEVIGKRLPIAVEYAIGPHWAKA